MKQPTYVAYKKYQCFSHKHKIVVNMLNEISANRTYHPVPEIEKLTWFFVSGYFSFTSFSQIVLTQKHFVLEPRIFQLPSSILYHLHGLGSKTSNEKNPTIREILGKNQQLKLWYFTYSFNLYYFDIRYY